MVAGLGTRKLREKSLAKKENIESKKHERNHQMGSDSRSLAHHIASEKQVRLDVKTYHQIPSNSMLKCWEAKAADNYLRKNGERLVMSTFKLKWHRQKLRKPIIEEIH